MNPTFRLQWIQPVLSYNDSSGVVPLEGRWDACGGYRRLTFKLIAWHLIKMNGNETTIVTYM